MEEFNSKHATSLKDVGGLSKFIVESGNEYLALDEWIGEAWSQDRKVVSLRSCSTTYLSEDTLVNVIG